MSVVETLATLFQENRQAEMAPLFRDLLTRERRTEPELAYEIYLVLYARGNHELALRFLLSFCQSYPTANTLLLTFGKKLYGEQDKDVGANLLMIHLDADGHDVEAYELCVSYCISRQLYDHVVTVYGKFQRYFQDRELRLGSLFDVATAFMCLGRFDEALRLYMLCLEIHPGLELAIMNVRHLAVVELYPPAIERLRQVYNDVASLPLIERRLANPSAPAEVRWSGRETEDVIDSLMANGFCLIRGGCSSEGVAGLLTHLEELFAVGTVFPIGFTPKIREAAESLFRFNPAAIIQAITARPHRIDDKACVARRVSPDQGGSFVPFHQDSTAFTKSLFNIWTPVTPAGGDYPSLQLVRKLVTAAEQTRLFEGEYNLIEIEVERVMEKYGDLLFEVEAAEPGDCVFFYGTTIHRSCNLERATKPRFNIETRWSPV